MHVPSPAAMAFGAIAFPRGVFNSPAECCPSERTPFVCVRRWRACRWTLSPFVVDGLERIRVGLLLDRHPLPLGEFLPIGRTADTCAIAGGAGAAEWHMRLVGDGLVVDMKEAGVEAIADRNRAADVGRKHA